MAFDPLLRRSPKSSRSKSSQSKFWRSKLSVAVGAIALLSAAVALVAPSSVSRADQFNAYRVFTDSGPVSQEDKDRRRASRDALRDRFISQYRMDVPFVSEAAVAGLQQAIMQYERIVASGGWQRVPGNTTLRPGDASSEIAIIRKHLIIEGDLPPGSRMGSRFDDEFRDGLARFQIRNGLRVSGFVDRRTLKALNVTAPERLRQLKTNVPRIKKHMRINRASRYVLVNVPAYTAQAVEKSRLVFDSPVIVGKPSRASPQLTARIIEVNFFPTWSVPDSIARKDLIPAIQKNPSYFDEQQFHVMRSWGSAPIDPATVDWTSPKAVSYKFRQAPGPQNALGLVRINMPNKHSVYMHDTPLKRLFNQSLRAFSSGCVRVEKIYELSAWLLGPQGWSQAKVEAQIASGKRKNVKLRHSVPVHFVYITAFANSSGVAQFRPDIYGRDATQGGLDDRRDALVVSESRAVTP
jgi:murein L,D-transpeptidase YcbB/YkuD